jgi:hypothetical protein
VKHTKWARVAMAFGMVVGSAAYLHADDKGKPDDAAGVPKSDATQTDGTQTDATQAAAKADEQGFQSLFDGKTLNGWEGREGFWSVQDGAITGQTKEPFRGPNTFLVWKGGDVADFELRLRYKIVGGNSGIQYRSKVTDPKLFRVGGYQADFEAGTTFSGINYEEMGRGILAQRGTKVTLEAGGAKKEEKLPMTSEQLQKSIRQNDWNEYVVVARGPHLVHKINGNVTSEVIDNSDKAAKSGVLALQLHAGPAMTVQFKDVRIKKL